MEVERNDCLMMVMPAMRMISADMTRYAGLLSIEVYNRCVIGLLFRRLCKEVRSVLMVSAAMWIIDHNHQ